MTQSIFLDTYTTRGDLLFGSFAVMKVLEK